MFDLNMNVGQYDLYFMVQWFCFICERPFDIWTSYFQIMKWYYKYLTWVWVLVIMTYI